MNHESRITNHEDRKLKLAAVWSFGLAALILALLAFTGCVSSGEPRPTNEARVASVVKVAAFVGTTEYLRDHPERRDKFELARDELRLLAADPALDMAKILAIAQRLPVKEMRDERVVLYVGAATLVLEEFGQGAWDLDRVQYLRPVALAMADGIDLAITTSSAPSN
jgi:hypothetical protein